MKIEGTLYPLPATRASSRGHDSVESASASDDAVYFEPEEKRRQNQNKERQPESENKPEELAVEVELHLGEDQNKAALPGADVVASIEEKKAVPRIVDVLA